ncbi:unnamed protein product [Sphenostylis stenocarpa]|uniref:Uncharacterized protein n=1 Tax=Sphenostylis stenocarpa TaxID=92480 RepID=A0AA86VRT6_9FABA|nr:unnamed protein product [Sphenostylis stenocarpa]
MDRREFHLQPMSICYRIYHFLIKSLTSQASKTVTLGRSRHESSSSTALRGSESRAEKEVQSETPSEVDDDKKLPPSEGIVADSISSDVQEAEEKNNPCMNVDNKMEGKNEVFTLPTPSLAPTRSIKKTVSINENVEEIRPPKKLKRKWSKSLQKIGSRDEDEESMPPPRSILKVSSDLSDKSYSFS